jgi:hypothetical protein
VLTGGRNEHEPETRRHPVSARISHAEINVVIRRAVCQAAAMTSGRLIIGRRVGR